MRRLALLVLTVPFLIAGCRGSEPHAEKRRAPKAKSPSQPAAPQTPSTEVGAAMPPYTGQWLEGKSFDLAAEKGKVVLLNTWATWCGPCRLEIPELNRLHAKYGKRGFTVVGVSVDESGADAVKPFVEEAKIRYPVVLDPDGRLVNLLQTQVIPTSLLIDRKGKIVWRTVGAIEPSDARLQKALETALKGK